MKGKCPYCMETDDLREYDDGEKICDPCAEFFEEKVAMREMESQGLEKCLREEN